MLQLHMTTYVFPPSRRVGSGCLAIPPLARLVARHFSGGDVDDSRHLRSLLVERPEPAVHLTAHAAEFAAFFEKNLVDPE